jgi:ABC-type cobalamin transport system ATPase subunit
MSWARRSNCEKEEGSGLTKDSPIATCVRLGASAEATNFELHAVGPSGGKSRVVARIAGRMTLQGIFQDGRVLSSKLAWSMVVWTAGSE